MSPSPKTTTGQLSPIQKIKRALHGHWEIDAASLWDRESLHLLGQVHLKLRSGGLGQIQLAALEADIDWRLRILNKEPLIEFSFEGNDDGDPVSGRGVATIDGFSLRGELFVHLGDMSSFTAKKVARR